MKGATANYNGLNHQFTPKEMLVISVDVMLAIVQSADLDQYQKEQIIKRERLIAFKALDALKDE